MIYDDVMSMVFVCWWIS